MTYIGSNQRLDRYRKVYCLDKHPFQARSFRDEQLAVYIRYAVDLDVRERFLSFADCSNCRETLKQRVGKCLERSANSSSVLRWCSCHGWKGQKEVRSLHPNVVYIHCIVHRLKLVIVASCLSTRHAVSFFSNIEGAFHWAFSGGSLAMHESPADRDWSPRCVPLGTAHQLAAGLLNVMCPQSLYVFFSRPANNKVTFWFKWLMCAY